MTYQEQLLDPRWIKLRDRVLERDWHMCQKCMRSSNLHVHHKKYKKGHMAWEYGMFDLVTLCGTCHKEEHGIDETLPDLNDPFVKLPYLFEGYFGLCMQMARKEAEEKRLQKTAEGEDNG